MIHPNDSFKRNRKFANEVKKTYDVLLQDLTLKARAGHKKSAVLLLEKMAEQNIVLYHLGFRISDEGRLNYVD
jgi:hypothetical protein